MGFDVFEVETKIVIGETIAEGARERFGGGGADGVLGGDEASAGKVIEGVSERAS